VPDEIFQRSGAYGDGGRADGHCRLSRRTAGLSQQADPPDEFAAVMKADFAKFTKVIKTANIKIED
jgi:hypothetical protein